MAVTLKDLGDVVGALAGRVSALEALAASNKARLDRIDATANTASADAAVAKAALDRDRFLRSLRRR